MLTNYWSVSKTAETDPSRPRPQNSGMFLRHPVRQLVLPYSLWSSASSSSSFWFHQAVRRVLLEHRLDVSVAGSSCSTLLVRGVPSDVDEILGDAFVWFSAFCAGVEPTQVQTAHVQQSDVLRPLRIAALRTYSPGTQVRLWVSIFLLMTTVDGGSGGMAAGRPTWT